MCGIVGYTGEQNAVDIVLDGLKKLEYRGYDSAGVALFRDKDLSCIKTSGKLAVLDGMLNTTEHSANLAIGHTRWATHGVPSSENAHPHFDDPCEIAVVHNGIIENFQEIRNALGKDGITFRSETDSEVLPHLIRKYYDGDLKSAVQKALGDVKGAYALVAICKDHPERMVAARCGSPLIVGVGDGEMFIASDAPAIMKYTRKVIYLDNGMVCDVNRDGYTVEDLDGNAQHPETCTFDWDISAAEKEGYPHFMLKEIFQQPQVIIDVMRGRINEDSLEVALEDFGISIEALQKCGRISIVACGTAWHAGLVGRYLLENIAKVRADVDVASEFRYRNTIISSDSIMIAVSQSGETADTLEAIRIARSQGATVASIVNVVGSSIARESDGVIYTHAGPEIGVASTKAYTAQLTAFALLAIYIGRLRNSISREEESELVGHLLEVPDKVTRCLENHDALEQCAKKFKYVVAHSALFLGRTYNYPSALEGALKLKEISYIHAEGYAAGEMKHGPIALVTDSVPTICIVTQGAVYEKLVSNMQEIRARRGIILAIATEGDENISQYCDDVIYVPECFEPFSPLLVAIPVQLFAYYIAVSRGCDVDQPRNLAKSVTVE